MRALPSFGSNYQRAYFIQRAATNPVFQKLLKLYSDPLCQSMSPGERHLKVLIPHWERTPLPVKGLHFLLTKWKYRQQNVLKVLKIELIVQKNGPRQCFTITCDAFGLVLLLRCAAEV